MIANMRVEFRASALLLFVAAIYFALVAGFVARRKGDGDLSVLLPHGITNQGLLIVWAITLGLMGAAYCAKLFLARGRSTIRERLAIDLKEFLRPETLSLRVSIFVSWYVLMHVFATFKTMIGSVHGFTMDPSIAALERAALFGHDAWQYTHFLLGSPLGTFMLQMCYNVWFALMWASILVCLLFVKNVRAVLHYLLAFSLCWIVVGSLAAYFLASAGPCFYQRVFSDPHFQPLMLRLHEIDRSLNLTSLDVQDTLWSWYGEHRNGLGAGISAMPSVHVGLAFVMARGAYLLRPLYGRIMMVYMAAIWIGSVHLGWHYALDGAVALLLVAPIWKISGWLARACLDVPRQRVAQGMLA
jgi:hypothetical protein